jgi:chromate transporter
MEKNFMSMKKNMMLFKWFLKFGMITPRDDYSVHDYIKADFCPEHMSVEEFDEKEQLLRDTPGPVSIKYAYFVGNKVNGISGALSAMAATFLPIFVIAAALFFAYPLIENIERTIQITDGVHAAALGLIAAQVYKISYFNKIRRKSLFIVLPAAMIFLFLPQLMGVGVPGSGATLMPFFIAGIIITGILLGFVHSKVEKYQAGKPPKYIDPYSRKAKKMRDRQLREEEYELMKYRDDSALKKLKEELKEKVRIRKYRDDD